MNATGSGLNLNLGFDFTKSLIGEVGYGLLSFKSLRSISGGTEWHETSRSGNISFGFPVPSSATTITAHGARGQAGYRFLLGIPKLRGTRISLLADGSVGYRAIFSTSREAGSSGDHTNRVTEKMTLGSSPYVQPRLRVLFGERTSGTLALSFTHEHYLAGDFSHSWGVGVVFGSKF